MLTNLTKKNKILLTDYDYQKDIKCRLLMSQFTTLDLLVAEEVINGYLKMSATAMARDLEIETSSLMPILHKFEKVDLLKLTADEVHVDKEMRKYFEYQMPKFDDAFSPGMDFLMSLLKKVPIQILPIWYSIPRFSDSILDSIVERFLRTPRVFEQYLEELNFEDPIFTQIVRDVFESPELRVFSSDLRKKYNLSRELFEEYMLHLEFNFICCISYNQLEERWKEVVTPFQEWKDYLLFRKETTCSPVQPDEVHENTYLDELKAALENSSSRDGSMESRLSELDFLQEGKVSKWGEQWLELPMSIDRALFLYRHPRMRMYFDGTLQSEKEIREIERELRRILHGNWVDFEDFFKGCTCGIAGFNAVHLERQSAKRWEYVLPKYSDSAKRMIHSVIFQRLKDLGFVQTGSCKGCDCFRVTRLGQVALAH